MSPVYRLFLDASALTSHADAVDKILSYLQNPTEQQTIANARKARCLGEHNMTQRARAFWEIVKQALT